MTNILQCSRCGVSEYKPDDVISFVCGSCMVRRVHRVEKTEEAHLGEYSPERSKAARKAQTPKWTQKVLAFKLDIPVGHVSEFERGAALIDPKHAEWLDAQ